MNETYQKLVKLIETLQTTGKIRLAKSDFRFYSESLPEGRLKKEIPDVEIEQSILNYYRQIDFVNILWYIADVKQMNYLDKEVDGVEGSLYIPNFTTFVYNLKNNKTQSIADPYKTLPESDYGSLIDYIPFDILNGDGAVCFKKTDGVIKDELHLVYVGSDSFIKPLHTDIKNYLNSGLEHYFFNRWQQAVFLDDQKSKEQMDFYLKQLVSTIGEVI